MNYAKTLFGILFIFGSATIGSAQKESKPLDVSTQVRTEASSGLGYLKGRALALELLKSGYQLEDFSPEGFVDGFREAMKGKNSPVQTQSFKVAMDLMQAKLQERELKLAKENLAKAAEWLATNGQVKGVKTTPSGLQYQVVTEGKGEVFKANKAKTGKPDQRRFLIRYQSSTVDGVVFEQSPKDKIVAVGEQMLPGLEEALRMMPVGSTWKLFLKPELAYGERRLGALVEPNSVLVMEVALLGIKAVEVRK